MFENRSPWLHQLQRTRPAIPLDRNCKGDVVIVGGGIAGIVTAYFTLKNTNRSVIVLEAGKVAHGATGHNAGYLATYFERSFSSLVSEFGLVEAARAQRGVEMAWDLIEQIKQDVGFKTPLYKFVGHAGCSTVSQLLFHLENNYWRKKAGLPTEIFFVRRGAGIARQIPQKYKGLYSEADHSEILSVLETQNPAYIAALSYVKGCMNSATFTEELAAHMLATYSGRFLLHEETVVTEVVLKSGQATITTEQHSIEAKNVVLCTNGFENFSIINTAGRDVDSKFHHLVQGKIGYMVGYLDHSNRPPAAISYLVSPLAGADPNDPTGDPYYYFTRRPHSHASGATHNLICIGGPEEDLPDRTIYSRDNDYSESARQEMDTFMRNNYRHCRNEKIEYEFMWHGLMGYTPNGVRLVGAEPRNPCLLYNLGCNGIGIMPSIFGAHQTSMRLKGIPMRPSIFDPRDQFAGIEAPASVKAGTASFVI